MILLVFETTSGLSGDWRESSHFPMKEEIQVQALANILGCRVKIFQKFILACLWALNTRHWKYGMAL